MLLSSLESEMRSVLLLFVLQDASHLCGDAPPICIALLWKILVGEVTGMSPECNAGTESSKFQHPPSIGDV